MAIDITQYRASIGTFNQKPMKPKKIFYNAGGVELDEDFKDGCGTLAYSIFSIIYFGSILCNLTFTLTTSLYLLTICADVQPHPGPTTLLGNLTLCHINIRSINADNRWDAFVTQLANAFDIISTSETWLSADQVSTKFEIPGYGGPFRLDRQLQGGEGSWYG